MSVKYVWTAFILLNYTHKHKPASQFLWWDYVFIKPDFIPIVSKKMYNVTNWLNNWYSKPIDQSAGRSHEVKSVPYSVDIVPIHFIIILSMYSSSPIEYTSWDTTLICLRQNHHSSRAKCSEFVEFFMLYIQQKIS